MQSSNNKQSTMLKQLKSIRNGELVKLGHKVLRRECGVGTFVVLSYHNDSNKFIKRKNTTLVETV